MALATSILDSFWGAIEELETQENGVVVARSGYKWHCIYDGKVMQLIKQSGTSISKDKSLVCSMRTAENLGYCWKIGNNMKAWKENGQCKSRPVSEVNCCSILMLK